MSISARSSLLIPSPPPPPPEALDTAVPGTAVAPRTLEEARLQVAQQVRRTLYPAFAAGLPAGDVIAVNAPWRTRSGSEEYLWVEVSGWRGDAITGHLATEPVDVAGLHKGDPVTVRQDEIYDFVWKHADGRRD